MDWLYIGTSGPKIGFEWDPSRKLKNGSKDAIMSAGQLDYTLYEPDLLSMMVVDSGTHHA